MGTPRFKPARIWTNPRHFGRHGQPQPNAENPLTPAQTAWAIFQHRAALAVTVELRSRRQTSAELAEQLNADHAWLVRKLHGQTPADLGDIMEWVLHYGIQILPEFTSLRELQIENSRE